MLNSLSYALRQFLCIGGLGMLAITPGWAQSSLLTAVEQGRLDQVNLVLQQADATQQLAQSDARGRSALLIATWNNAIEIAQALVNAGADVNQKDAIQDSPYLVAGAQGRTDILAIFLRHGADLKSTNRYGGTALIPAAEKGHRAAVQMLLKAGVNPNHINRLGWTALHEAIVLSDGGPIHQQIIRDLIAAGADVNLPDGQGTRPLSLARQHGQTQSAQILLDAGALP